MKEFFFSLGLFLFCFVTFCFDVVYFICVFVCLVSLLHKLRLLLLKGHIHI